MSSHYKKKQIDTGENKLSAEQIGGLVSITLCQLIEKLWSK